MFEATVDINAKDYNACTLYYLKKFVGVKEYILVGFLLIGGLVLFFAFNQWLILALCGVTVLLMAAAIVVYIALARKGYREEFVKRNTHEWKFTFFDEEFTVETLEENGEKPYTEKFSYDRVERVALRKDRVYIYCGAALAYYIRYDNMTAGTFIDFCEFVKKKIEPAKFKMKEGRRKNKQFPYGR